MMSFPDLNDILGGGRSYDGLFFFVPDRSADGETRVLFHADSCRPRWLDEETESPFDGWEVKLKGISCRRGMVRPANSSEDSGEGDPEEWAWAIEWSGDERRPTIAELEAVDWLDW